MITPLVMGLGTTELLLILAVVVLLFGASKLPELARGSGRALRIFKAETKGLVDDDDEAEAPRKSLPNESSDSSSDIANETRREQGHNG